MPQLTKNGGNGWEVPQIVGHNYFGTSTLTRLMLDKRIFNFQIPGTTQTTFQGVFEPFTAYDSLANWTNYLSSWDNGEFFWGKKCCAFFPHSKWGKRHKRSALTISQQILVRIGAELVLTPGCRSEGGEEV